MGYYSGIEQRNGKNQMTTNQTNEQRQGALAYFMALAAEKAGHPVRGAIEFNTAASPCNDTLTVGGEVIWAGANARAKWGMVPSGA